MSKTSAIRFALFRKTGREVNGETDGSGKEKLSEILDGDAGCVPRQLPEYIVEEVINARSSEASLFYEKNKNFA